MWRTNLAVALTVLGTLAVYTVVANVIPQVESDVPTQLVLSSEVTSAELVAAGEEIFLGSAGGCTACHGLGTRAPDLIGVAGTVCGTRKPELNCKDYLYESLTSPSAYVVDGFQPIMTDMSRTLSGAQIWSLVAFLQSQGGEVTVDADDVAAAADDATGAGGDAAAPGATMMDASASPADMIQALGCTACHSLGGEGGALGPSFDGMGSLEADYIRRSILQPAADTASGFENFVGTMPPNLGDQLTATQLESLVDFLATQGEQR